MSGICLNLLWNESIVTFLLNVKTAKFFLSYGFRE